jgi:ectoine hydroxylase-related dioxygenase (phytanoyl-CoA dioxygenase family)
MIKLNEQIITDFENNGFAIIPNVLDEALMNEIIKVGDKLLSSDDQSMRASMNKDTDSFRNCITKDEVFMKLLIQDEVFPYIIRLLGADIRLLTSHLIYRYKCKEKDIWANNGWHRDFHQAQKSLGHASIPRLDIKVAYCLNDLQTENSGGTLFVPGSHKLKKGLDIENNSNPKNTVEPKVKKGDCVIFENRTWHAGAANNSEEIRKVVMFGYTYSWIASYDYEHHQPTVDLAKKHYGDLGLQLLNAVPKPVNFSVDYYEKPIQNWAKKNNIPTYREFVK